jgi:hypothetical protein
MDRITKISIGQGMTSPLPVQLEKQVVGFNLNGMYLANVSHKLVNEIGRNIDGTLCMDGFDLRSIFQWTTVLNVNTIFCYIDILYKKNKCQTVLSMDDILKRKRLSSRESHPHVQRLTPKFKDSSQKHSKIGPKYQGVAFTFFCIFLSSP